jgi:hypothetical protein
MLIVYHPWLSAVSYLLKALSFLPDLKKIQGTGNSATAINPSKLEAQPVPNLLYTRGMVRKVATKNGKISTHFGW